MSRKQANRYPYKTKSQLIQMLAKESKLNKKMADFVIDKVLGFIISSLQAGNRVEIRNFGTFELRQYKAYKARNPQTGEKVNVEAKTMPFFKIGKLKEFINKK